MSVSRLPFDLRGLMERIDLRTKKYMSDKDLNSYLAFMKEHFNPFVLNAHARNTSHFEDYYEMENCIAKIAEYAKFMDRLFSKQLKRCERYQFGIFEPYVPRPPLSNDRLKMKARELGIEPIETIFSSDDASSSDVSSPSLSLIFQGLNFEGDGLHQFEVYEDKGSSWGLK